MQLILSATDNSQVYFTKCPRTPRGSLHPPNNYAHPPPTQHPPPPTALFLSALSQPMRAHSTGAAEKRSYVPQWQELISNFLHSGCVVPSDSGNLAHAAGILLGAGDQRDGCLHLSRLTDVRQGAHAVFTILLF